VELVSLPPDKFMSPPCYITDTCNKLKRG